MRIGKNNINYIQYGKGSDVVLLHGWGQNIEMMKPLGDKIRNKRITIIDFPGFGLSNEPVDPWSLIDYVNSLKDVLDELKIKNPILIGHSFGGRVAIKYASLYNVKKVILFGAPCVRENRVSKKEKILKSIKKLPFMDKFGEYMKNYIGSEDYKNASKIMREILVNVVNEDLSEDAKKISVPTLLIWGDLDTAAPLSDAKKLEKLLKDVGLVVVNGCSHYAYLEALDYVSNIVNNFTEEK